MSDLAVTGKNNNLFFDLVGSLKSESAIQQNGSAGVFEQKEESFDGLNSLCRELKESDIPTEKSTFENILDSLVSEFMTKNLSKTDTVSSKKYDAEVSDDYKTIYDENGNKKASVVIDKLSGKVLSAVEYYENGQVKNAISFEYQTGRMLGLAPGMNNWGMCIIEQREYYENGNKKNELKIQNGTNNNEHSNGPKKYMCIEQTEYLENGKPKKEESVHGYDNKFGDINSTNYEYDKDGNLKSSIRMVGDEIEGQDEYYENGNLKKTTNGRHLQKFMYSDIQEEYYEDGRIKSHTVISKKDGHIGAKTEYEYFEDGTPKKVTEMSVNYGNQYQYIREYSNDGKLKTLTTFCDGELQEKENYEYEYYDNGNQKNYLVKDMYGNMINQEQYDETGRLMRSIERKRISDNPPQYEVLKEKELYSNGKTKSESTTHLYSGSKTLEEYNEDGTKKSVTEIAKDGTIEKTEYKYEYYDNGKLKSYAEIKPDGTIDKTEYEYNEKGKRKNIKHTTDTYKEETNCNQNGKPKDKTKTYSDGFVAQTDYEYKENINGIEKLSKVTTTGSDGSQETTNYGKYSPYNFDAPLETNYSDGRKVEYKYDILGNDFGSIKTCTDETGKNIDTTNTAVQNFRYEKYEVELKRNDSGNRVYTMTYPGGSKQIEEYHKNGKLKCMEYISKEQQEETSKIEEYNENGQIEKTIEKNKSGSQHETKYNNDGQVEYSIYKNSNGSIIDGDEYEYYKNGHTRTERRYYADGSIEKAEYYEDGRIKCRTMVYPDGEERKTDYKYDEKNKILLSINTTSTNGSQNTFELLNTEFLQYL